MADTKPERESCKLSKSNSQMPPKFNLAGRKALVVGGTNGIGRGMCVWLAQQHASVVVAGRSQERGLEVVEEMKKAAAAAGPIDPPPTFGFAPIDCYMVADTRRFARAFSEEHKALDYLVISAGISTFQGRTETKEGLDQKLAIHYYTRVSLIKALMPLLEATAAQGRDVRVMSILSGGVHRPYPDYATDPELKNNYSLKNAANSAGFYNDIAVESLSKLHPTVEFSHVAPGFVDTAWGSGMNFVVKGAIRVLQKLFARTPAQCAEAISSALVSPAFKAPGFHIIDKDGKAARVTPLQAAALEPVWKSTEEVLARVPDQ